VSKAIKRAALTVPFIALAAGIGLVWTISQPERSDTHDAVETDAPGNAEPAGLDAKAAERAPASAAAASIPAAPAPTDAPARSKAVALGHISEPGQQLKPYVALALTETAKTTEELCPELAQKDDGKTSPDSAEAGKPHADAKGCVLPIGSEPAASVEQAAIPLESGRPPAPFPRAKGFNFLPYAGGLGAAVAAVPVIGGLNDNKNSSQPVSPD